MIQTFIKSSTFVYIGGGHFHSSGADQYTKVFISRKYSQFYLKDNVVYF